VLVLPGPRALILRLGSGLSPDGSPNVAHTSQVTPAPGSGQVLSSAQGNR